MTTKEKIKYNAESVGTDDLLGLWVGEFHDDVHVVAIFEPLEHLETLKKLKIPNNFNNLSGLITINIFSKIGVGLGNNLNMAQRIRNLYNRVKLNDIFFEPSSGPTVINNAAPEGYVQTVMSISFEVLESL